MDFNAKCPKLPWMIDFHSDETGKVLNSQYEAAFAKTTLEYLSALNIKSRPSLYRSTQLICTIPLNVTCKTIENMLELGMSVARIIAVKHEKILEVLSKVRAVNDNYSRKIGRLNPLAIALEVRGPEIRTGQLKGSSKQIFLEKGKITTLTTNPSYEDFVNEEMIYVDYEKLPEVIHAGDKVLLDNGSVTLSAIECAESMIRCIVEKAGVLLGNTSVILPDAPVDLPPLSNDDKKLLEICIGENIDYLFVSGVNSKEGVLIVRDLLGQSGEKIQIISKIGTSVAVEHIEEIMQVSDCICIDSEKLVMELPKEKVFLVQKSVLATCNIAGKPAVCFISIADQSCVSKSEVSDIANAVMDGVDALMISRDACCNDVVKSINMICKEAESAVYQNQVFRELIDTIQSPMEIIYSLAISAVETSLKTNAAAIVCLTSSGRTAKLIARFRPKCPIIAVTRYGRIARQLKLYKGIEPLIYMKAFKGNWIKDVESRVQLGITYGKYIGYIRTADAVVSVTASRPECGMPNTMKVVYASDFDTLPKLQKDLL